MAPFFFVLFNFSLCIKAVVCVWVCGWTHLTQFPIIQHGTGNLGHKLLRGFIEVW